MRNASELPIFPNPLRKTSRRFGGSALSGFLLFACFPLLDWNLLVWIACLPLLAALVNEPNLARGFLWAYLSGAVFLAGSFYWFGGVMERHGGLSTTLAVLVLGIFVIVFSVFFGVFGLVEAWTARHSPARALLLSPFLWISMELARTYLITGFPWNLLGYAVQAPGLRQMASVTAVYGLSFLAVATSALLAWALLEPRRGWVRAVLAFWLAGLTIANFVSMPAALPPGTNRAYLVQPNVPLDDAAQADWAPWRNPAPLERLVAMSVRSREGVPTAGPPLIIWAENPAPFYFNRDPVFRGAIEGMARDAQAYVIAGTVMYAGNDTTQPKNSGVVLDPTGRLLHQYDKIHLVPFGEYVPRWAFPGKVGRITLEVADYIPGSSYQVARTPHGAFGIFICYEAIFPQLVRRLTPTAAGVLVNISNDAWYGDSSAAFQHLEMARLRAIENGRYLLRATNDGITAVIDPYGRVVERLPRKQTMVLRGQFDYLVRRTFYTAYGDVFAWLCVAITVMALGLQITEGGKQKAAT